MNWEKRVIIGGLPRSGSTLLRWHLDAAKEIISPPETTFFQFLLSVNQDRLEARSRRIDRALDVGTDVISEILLKSVSSVEAFDELMSVWAEKLGLTASVWAEKTPWNCLSYHWLANEKIDLWFVSTIRDGRDVVTSQHWKKNRPYHCGVQRYVDAMRLIYDFQHPRHLIIKYEDLVRNTEDVLRNLFAAMGLSWDNDMLDAACLESDTRKSKDDRQPLLNQKPTTLLINRWKGLEYEERVSEFTEHPEAMYWLEESGYLV